MSDKVKITQIRSIIGRPEKHRRIIRALGLKKIHMSIEHKNNKAIVGMAKKIPHLVKMEEI